MYVGIHDNIAQYFDLMNLSHDFKMPDEALLGCRIREQLKSAVTGKRDEAGKGGVVVVTQSGHD